jgi:hypothetical protein
MRTRLSGRWLWGLAAVGLAACGGQLSTAGAVEGDDGGGDGGAGQDASEMVGAQDGGDDGAPAFLGSQPNNVIAEDAGCPTNVLTYEPPGATFGSCWMCTKRSCSSEVIACSVDCTCNDAVVGALICVDNGGLTTQCFTSAFSSANDSTLSAIAGCLIGVQTQCCATPADAGSNPG